MEWADDEWCEECGEEGEWRPLYGQTLCAGCYRVFLDEDDDCDYSCGGE